MRAFTGGARERSRWDGRNPSLQDQARRAIISPLEMHASREPTRRQFDALAEFQRSLADSPPGAGQFAGA